ncbi:hypothetical protein AtubIFM57143_000915 [Aspergillus tubingensis]|nr:hypothetical protein AtubIFM57143_000915 [Aspergillus tubingensis]
MKDQNDYLKDQKNLDLNENWDYEDQEDLDYLEDQKDLYYHYLKDLKVDHYYR